MPTHISIQCTDDPTSCVTEMYICNDDIPERPFYALVALVRWDEIVWC